MTTDSSWFRLLGGDGGWHRVYLFPHAGAGCSQMVPFARELEAHGLEVFSVSLPGRQMRLDEEPRTDLLRLAGELAGELAGRDADGPYSLFGYCGGALLAFELARALHAEGGRAPERLWVASFEAPDIARLPRRVASLPSDALWTYLAAEGGVPPSALRTPALRDVAEPALRADFGWLGGYRFEPGTELDVPITVFHGERDDTVPRGALLGWRRHTRGGIGLHAVPGGHWLLDDAPAELAAACARFLSVTGDA